MKHVTLALILLGAVSACSAEDHRAATSAQPANTAKPQPASTTKIRLTINSQQITATLADNPTTRDFMTLLPMTLKFDDYASTEKIFYLPRKLSTKGAPAGMDPEAGDITYYAPWGNLAIFYRDFGYSAGLIKLGRIEAGAEALAAPGSLNARIEVLGK